VADRKRVQDILIRLARVGAAALLGGIIGLAFSFWEIRAKYLRLFEHDLEYTLQGLQDHSKRVSSASTALRAYFRASREVENGEYDTFCRILLADIPFIDFLCTLDQVGGGEHHYPEPHTVPPELRGKTGDPGVWLRPDSDHLVFYIPSEDGLLVLIGVKKENILPSDIPDYISIGISLAATPNGTDNVPIAGWRTDVRPPLLGTTIRRKLALEATGRIWDVRAVSLNRAGPDDQAFMILTIAGAAGIAVLLQQLAQRRRELRQRDEQLRQAQKMELIGLMAGGIAHDFNNVLAGVSGTASGIADGLEAGFVPGREALREAIGIIMMAARRGRDIVSRLLSLAKPAPLAKAPFDLRATLAEVAELAGKTCDRSVAFVLTIPGEGPMSCVGDGGQIAQALLNLAINAAQSMTSMRPEGQIKGGTVGLSLETVGVDAAFHKRHPGAAQGARFFRIEVTDSGVGMDRAALDKLFSPFYSTKRAQGGSGLGLLMTHSIIQSHGGHMEVESRPAQGTRITVYLPALG